MPAPLHTPVPTSRLRLRPWREDDLRAFRALNADPAVMEYLGEPLSGAASDALAGRLQSAIASRGFGFWVLERRDGEFLGFAGLSIPAFETAFTPCVEIGWRLAAGHWGQGYASEAARACLGFGFGSLALREIVAFTALGNRRSRAVMERIGMTRDPRGDFDHPRFAAAHRLRRHVLYRIAATEPDASASHER